MEGERSRPRLRWMCLAAVLLAALALSVSTARKVSQECGPAAFPLDDAWIHLQFARNLHDYGSFSYYRDEMVTSGSTSPLYTLLLAAGFFATRDEVLLSHSLGIAFLLACGAATFLLALRLLGSLAFATAATALVLLEPRLQWAALSGMETTLFLFLLACVTLAFEARRPVALGVASGLLVWTRPESVIFLGVVAAQALRDLLVARRDGERARLSVVRSWSMPVAITAAFAAGLAAFDLALSGTLLPNTFAAKLRYYAHAGGDFPAEVLRWMTHDQKALLAALACVGAAIVVARAPMRSQHAPLYLVAWPVLLFAACWTKLPVLYQNGRYMMPALPSVVLLGVLAVQACFEAARRRAPSRGAVIGVAAWVVMALLLTQLFAASWRSRVELVETCGYIGDRQVRTALWSRNELPSDAVVATHDVGAIAFHSGRRVVDMVGVVTPDAVATIGHLDSLVPFLESKGATHVAVLRNWFAVENQEPLFRTGTADTGVMEVYRLVPGRTHFTDVAVASLLDEAARLLASGRVDDAGGHLLVALREDPNVARTHVLLARAFQLAGRPAEANAEIEAALRIQPDLAEALSSLDRPP